MAEREKLILSLRALGQFLMPINRKLVYDAADAIEKLQAANNELECTLAGVMHSVDKWLAGDDFEHGEVQRAAIMREKTLQIIENLDAQNTELLKEIAWLKSCKNCKIYADCPRHYSLIVHGCDHWIDTRGERKDND